MNKIDLHVHTKASSDGELSPEEILMLAVDEGVGVIAITDHDSIDCVSETIKKAPQYGVEALSGTELFCKKDEKFLHMLGYCFDTDALEINRLIKNIAADRDRWLTEQIKLFRKKGLYAEEDKAREFCRDTPPLFSSAAYAMFYDERNANHPLIDEYKKYENPVHQISVRLLAYGKPFYTPHYIPDTSDFIKAVKASGGVPVLAHPGYDQMRVDFNDKRFMDSLVQEGLEGVEVYYTTHTEDDIKTYLKYCLERDLIYTTGSDFHGRYKPSIRLGQLGITDYKIVENLKKRRDQIRVG
jgi:predicted metal-dependent phosphoesterase TrpH